MRITVDLPDWLVAQIDQRRSVLAPHEKATRPMILAEDLSALYDMEQHTRWELCRLFTRAELTYILEVVNGWAIAWPAPDPKTMLMAEITDGARHAGMAERHFPDDPQGLDRLLDKISDLKAFQVYVLLREAKLAWGTDDPVATLCKRLEALEREPDPAQPVETPPF